MREGLGAKTCGLNALTIAVTHLLIRILLSIA